MARMRSRISDVADGDALAPRFGDHGLFVDELLENLLLDAQLAQQLFAHLRAVGVAIRLELRRSSGAGTRAP